MPVHWAYVFRKHCSSSGRVSKRLSGKRKFEELKSVALLNICLIEFSLYFLLLLVPPFKTDSRCTCTVNIMTSTNTSNNKNIPLEEIPLQYHVTKRKMKHYAVVETSTVIN